MTDSKNLQKLYKLVISNMEVIEAAPSIVELIEKKLFQAINKRIEDRVKKRKTWTGYYELVSGGKDWTAFSPKDWETKEGEDPTRHSHYWLADYGEDAHWLSHAIGLDGRSLCFKLAIYEQAAVIKKPLKHLKNDFESFIKIVTYEKKVLNLMRMDIFSGHFSLKI